jgi:uncharacterized protein YjbJ (UPF0337 family)
VKSSARVSYTFGVRINLTTNTMANTTELKGHWNETKGKLKQQFAILTDDDLLLAEGKQDELMGRLQKKLGKTKDELHKIISGL